MCSVANFQANVCAVLQPFRLMYVQCCNLFQDNVCAVFWPFTLLKHSQKCWFDKNLALLLLHSKPSRGFDYSVVVINCFVDEAIVLKQRKYSLPSFQVSQGRILEERGTTAMRHGIDNYIKQWSEISMDILGHLLLLIDTRSDILCSFAWISCTMEKMLLTWLGQ